MKRLNVVFVIVTMVLTLAGPGIALAGAEPHMAGRFQGFYRSTDARDVSGSLTLSLTTEPERRLSGDVHGLGIESSLAVSGTVSDSGEFTLTGKNSETRNVVLHGRRSDIGESTDPYVLIGLYQVSFDSGAVDHGDFIVLHSTRADNLESDTPVSWQAYVTSDGTRRLVNLSFERDTSGELDGRLIWGETDTLALTGDTWSRPATRDGTPSGLLFVGGSNENLFATELEFTETSTGRQLIGPYRMLGEINERGTLRLQPSRDGGGCPPGGCS